PAGIGRHDFTVEIVDATGAVSAMPLTIKVLGTPDSPTAAAAVRSPATKAVTKSTGSTQSLSAILAALPEGEWAQVSLDSYSSAWTPKELRPLLGSTRNPPPDSIIKAWSSFAWDSR